MVRTLVIVSHPDIQGSSSQQFLKESLPIHEKITFHHLEACYPDGVIDIRAEQMLLREHDRIIFQFPFYWYSSPAMLKQWQDEVLTESFAFGSYGKALAGKSFGLVVVIGNRESEYQAGGREGYSFSSLTLPFQAMANKVGMQFLKPLGIFQFQYMDEAAKQQLLIRYQQYLVLADIDSLKEREEWLMQALAATSLTTLPEGSEFIIQETIEQISQARMELDELHLYLEGM
ncbi:NAD(P)H-dependent oxidoreductase [Enterococcus italicus]|uniref:NAD(P)H-dependent oxidoreductase n=1 Tax=Enterococcus italicus TaxID=246144 RepID=UPI0028B24D1E|nr:NAD(P)H-dependent oxidoreductase [Enterococcus italicus]